MSKTSAVENSDVVVRHEGNTAWINNSLICLGRFSRSPINGGSLVAEVNPSIAADDVEIKPSRTAAFNILSNCDDALKFLLDNLRDMHGIELSADQVATLRGVGE